MLQAAFANANWKWVGIAGISVVSCPLIWNIIARNERRNQTLTNALGSPRKGCYALAAWIFFNSLLRDKLFEIAIQKSKPSTIPFLGEEQNIASSTRKSIGIALTAVGMTFVAAAYYRLGIVNTYLGDYFGLLMSERVTAFPFNVLNDPMYTGATVAFVGLSVHENSPVGLLLSAWVWVVYEVSTKYFEGPYTAQIYKEKEEADRKNKK